MKIYETEYARLQPIRHLVFGSIDTAQSFRYKSVALM